MLALALLLYLLHGPIPQPSVRAVSVQLWDTTMSASDMATLHKRLMDRVETMDGSSQGIFNEDVTAMVAPYFPPGQSLRETAATLSEQGLGELLPFKGKTAPRDGTMFVSRFDLMSHVFAHVYVVLNFDFHRTAGNALRLDQVHAFLRSQSM